MIKKPVMIQIRNGLEARPVALLVQVASQYDSEIYVESEDRHVNAKSIMGMMTLGLNYGDSIVVSANVIDEEEAMKEIEKYLSGNLSDQKTKIKAVVPTKSLSGDSLFLWLACRRIFSLLQVYRTLSNRIYE